MQPLNERKALDVDRRRAHWDRLFWQAANGQVDPRDLARMVFTENDLCGVIGEGAYASLVEWASVDDDNLQAFDFRQLHAMAFARSCFCRRQSPLDYDEIDFSNRNVYRRLYFGDECVARTTETLFRRTPDIDLLHCEACGDHWLRGRDQDWGRQHFLLLESRDLARLEREGVWPDGLDMYEDNWTKAVGGMHRHSSELSAWQAAHNTSEAMRRFGRRPD